MHLSKPIKQHAESPLMYTDILKNCLGGWGDPGKNADYDMRICYKYMTQPEWRYGWNGADLNIFGNVWSPED